jgi:hypothetical protein
MPEGSSQYVYLQSKRWRALGYNWDILSTYDNTSRLYCLTDFQAAWLLSNTEYMRWSSRWQNCPCTQADLDAMKAEMEFNLMSCIDFSPYQLQTLYNNAQNALIQDYMNAWDGSLPSSVNPDAPDDYFNGDDSPDRNDALCTALTIFVYSYAVDWSNKASGILGLANAATALISAVVPFGGEIAVRVITGLLSPTIATFEAMANQEALDDIICDWLPLLDGTAITPSNWSDAIGSLTYTVDTDEYYIHQVLSPDTELLENFLTFVNSLGDAYQYAQLGISLCPCDETWEYEIDFTVESGTGDGWQIPANGWSSGWSSGNGWQSTSAPDPNRRVNGLECIFSSSAEITYFEFTFGGGGSFPVDTDTWLSGGYIDRS